MQDKTKITLSAKELELVCNTDWILTKQVIIEKVYQLFGKLSLVMQRTIREKAAFLPPEITGSSPKISKGENYRSLPYVMLDYPRLFSKASTVAIRTLFWWGNFFSINLHLTGDFKQKMAPALIERFSFLQNQGYWICVHSDPWEHHFEADNYVSLGNYTAAQFAAILGRESFIKIAKRISLEEWENAEMFLEHHFNELAGLLQISFPGGEKDLLPGIPITGSGP